MPIKLRPGTLVTNKLRLVRKVGEGGMGTVWVADHIALRSQVAVKFIAVPPGAALKPALRRFSREAALAAKLRHPNVVQVFDYGQTEDGRAYIVMELLEGQDLGTRLASGSPLPLAVTVEIVRQTAKALAAAHARGLVHRDVKPENIFLTDLDGELLVKVLDFGTAKQPGVGSMSGITLAGGVLGTPRYMSPEQTVCSKTLDYRTDLWSLAAVAYECLTGKGPFEGDNLARLMLHINSGVFEPLSNVRPDLPKELDTWFRTGLNREPALRFPSAKELSRQFEAATSGVAIPEPPEPTLSADAMSVRVQVRACDELAQTLALDPDEVARQAAHLHVLSLQASESVPEGVSPNRTLPSAHAEEPAQDSSETGDDASGPHSYVDRPDVSLPLATAPRTARTTWLSAVGLALGATVAVAALAFAMHLGAGGAELVASSHPVGPPLSHSGDVRSGAVANGAESSFPAVDAAPDGGDDGQSPQEPAGAER